MIGRQVTTSSRSATEVSSNRLGRRKTSIQTDVSTRSIASPARSFRSPGVAPHLGEFPFPETRPRELEEATGLMPPQVVLHGFGDRPRVRPLSADSGQLF